MKEHALSDKDLILIKSLEGNCRANYKRVADRLGISHTAVKKRVDKLLSKNCVSIITTLNLKKLGFILALLFLEVSTDEHLNKLLEKFRECPRIISMFKTFGEYNMIALIYAENEKVLDSILGTCMLRIMKGIRRSLVMPISDILLGEYYKVKIPVKKWDIAPCGIDCYNCKRYKSKECIGCPAVKCYTGWFSIKEDVS